MKIAQPPIASQPRRWAAPLVLLVVLAGLFWRSFLPNYVHFSNDGPLGTLVEEQNQLPQIFTGMWADLNSIGLNDGVATLSISSILRWILPPVVFAKNYPVIALLILGFGASFFFGN